MKKHLIIFLCFALSLSVCIGVALAHTGEDKSLEEGNEGEAVTEPAYQFPNDWSRPALEFAVEKGILQGDANRDLRPHDNITRAETAAVLVRLLGAKGTGQLEKFRDADPNAWYYKELSAAVAAGIFNGTGADTIEPTAPITREQVMVVLCRAFGIAVKDPSAYMEFSDNGQISAYARASIGALRAKGLLQGYPDGSLKPGDPISRAETAQLLYNLFDCIADSPEQLPASGRVLYRGTELLPQELRLDGSLILACNTPKEQTIGKWTIRDTLVLRMEEGSAPELGGLQCAQLVLCSPGAFRAMAEEVWLGGKGVELSGGAPFLGSLIGDHKAMGNYSEVQIYGGSVEIHGNVQKATLKRESSVSIQGNCKELYIGDRSKAKIQGDCSTISLGAFAQLELTGNVTALTMEAASVLQLEGHADSIEVLGQDAVLKGTGTATLVTLHESGCTVDLTVETLKDLPYENGYLKEHDAALETVKTHKVPCTIRSTVTMYRNQNLSGSMVTVPGGSRAYLEWNPSGSGIRVSYTDSKGSTWTGWVPRWSVAMHTSQAEYDGALDYSQATKEGFVDLLGYDSETDYLVWVSRYTQKVMVYEGSKGNWKLIKTMPCATGANYCPTPQGVYKLEGHRTVWDFGDYVVYNVTVYNGPFAFHTVLYYPSGKLMDGTIGQPKSQGCVRMLKEDSNYIYNLPLGTRVVIY